MPYPSNYVTVNPDYPKVYTLKATITRAGCTATQPTKSITVLPEHGYISSYPNPASNTLNIEVDRIAYERSQPLAQSKIDPIFDIRLYDGQGNLLRNAKVKDGKVEFNVSNLTTGIYYLHVYDGVNEKPEMRQIVVER